MKTLLFAAMAAILLTGCVERRVAYVPVYPTRPVYVQPAPVIASAPAPATQVIVPEAQQTAPSPPPPPLAEAVPLTPGPAYVWAPGYWAWTGKWVWVTGRWHARPFPTAHWVSGHWARHGHVYTWAPGHWR